MGNILDLVFEYQIVCKKGISTRNDIKTET